MANLQVVAKIGTLEFHGWHGRVRKIQREAEEFARLGQIGSGAQLVGQRAAKSVISVWRGESNKSSASTFADQAEQMQFQDAVAVTDPYGNTFRGCRVSSVVVAPIRTGKGSPISGNTQMTHLINIEFTLEVIEE
jgi:hypothetical protein